MRVPAITVANAIAWIILFGLIGAAVVMVTTLGPFGLILLGLMTLFICVSLNMNEDSPTWGTEVFKARLSTHGSPEQRAALKEERAQSLAPLTFYRWCGFALVVAGIAGFIWQQFH